MKIAHGLFTWQDGREALEACLASTGPYVDFTIVADGRIDGVPDLDLPDLSDLGWIPPAVVVSSRPWPSLSAACTYLLDAARSLGCDWLLTVDADQELRNGRYLRDWLEVYPGDAFPLQRCDGGRWLEVPWQCVRVAAFRRYIAGCFVAETIDGHVRAILPAGHAVRRLRWAPWISHHPERRPEGRRGHRLGDLEIVLEPPPPGLLAVNMVALHDFTPASA